MRSRTAAAGSEQGALARRPAAPRGRRWRAFDILQHHCWRGRFHRAGRRDVGGIAATGAAGFSLRRGRRPAATSTAGEIAIGLAQALAQIVLRQLADERTDLAGVGVLVGPASSSASNATRSAIASSVSPGPAKRARAPSTRRTGVRGPAGCCCRGRPAAPARHPHNPARQRQFGLHQVQSELVLERQLATVGMLIDLRLHGRAVAFFAIGLGGAQLIARAFAAARLARSSQAYTPRRGIGL